MKFFCDNCHTKYSIPDEKVRGKVLKIRCKNCSQIIMVREHESPEEHNPELVGLPPRPQMEWYYALNGTTHGPFPESVLQARYASGELGDETYVWNESFTDWLPVGQVPAFSRSLEEGSVIAPRNDTIGVSSALEALDRAALPEEEQSGFVPSYEDEPEEATRQMDASLFRAQMAAADSSAAALSSSAVEDAEPVGVGEEISTPIDSDLFSGIGPDPDHGFPAALGEGAAPDHSAAAEAARFDFSSPDMPHMDVVDPFDDLSTQHPDTAGLDFSQMGEPVGSGLTEASELGFSTEGSIGFDSAGITLGDDDDDEMFQPSGSLLIELDQIKKQGRNKRLIGLFAGFVVVSVIAAMAWRGSVAAEKKRKERDAALAAKIATPVQRNKLVFRTYSKAERSQLLKLDDDVITAAELAQFKEEDFPEDPPVEPKKAVAKADPKKAKPVSDTKTKPVAIARATTRKTSSAKKPDATRRTKRDPLLNLRGIEGGNTNTPSLTEALRKSKSGSTGSSTRLRTGAQAGGLAVAGSSKRVKKRSNTPSLDIRGINTGTTKRRTSGPSASIGLTSTSKTPSAGGALPKGLTKQAAKSGFRKVRRSVMLCRQRHARRGGAFKAGKFLITVEVAGDGKVASFSMTPNSLQHTVFYGCMERNKRRWVFPPFEGKPVKIQRTFVLE